EPYPYDPERARELLAEAGVSGLSLRIDVYTDPTLETIAQILQAELADIGVTLEIRTQPYSAYAEAVLEPSLELYASGWGTVTLDADYALYGFLHPSERGGGSNTSNYVNDHVTALLEEGRNNPDTDVRAAVYHEVQEIILEDLPFVTVNYPLSTFAKTAALQGEKVNFSVINFDLREATLNR
ncbi:MAG: ABC transporter substrate-binding protein, partial [Trueperaceae bacterium]